MSQPAERVNLDECAREPIHIPGAIQPHGFLLIVDPATRRVLQASASAADLLLRPLDEILGVEWSSLVECEAPTPLAADAEAPRHLEHRPLAVRGRDAPAYVASWHLYGTRWQLEAEPVAAVRVDHRALHELVRRIDEDADVETASSRVARAVRQMLEYDRVMIYRFDADWHGEVVAEAVRDTLEPYLGLHYPSTDIPAQARALYLRNRVRTIGDIRYEPSALVPVLDPVSHAPADLSDVSLRSVSPVHIEYLGNMGVRATLVVSIITNARLWGLIACHHYAPRYPQVEEREAADTLARALASRAGSLERMRRAAYEMRVETIRERLISHFSAKSEMTAEALHQFAPELLDAVDADGIALISGESIGRFGTLPDNETLLDLRRRIVESKGETLHHDVSGVLYTDHLDEAFPALSSVAGVAAGILYVPLDPSARSAILWTRVEQVRTVRWGGNPQLAKLEVIAGARLSPRQSFEAWQEDVRGRSLPWDAMNLEAARAFRVLVEVMDRRHYQAESGMLHATLEALQQPVIIVAMDSRGGAPSIVHVNQAFMDETGQRDGAGIFAIWPFAGVQSQRHFAGLQHFRLSPRADARERRALQLQPLAVENGRQHWLCLLERAPS
jgi:light-regulated signal transduction histidine kinase (bacteriophytochrome)